MVMYMSAGSNRLLDLLDQDGDRSISNLKRRYRLLCKETHPDLKKQDQASRHEAFLLLNAEYRAAAAALRPQESSCGSFVPGKASAATDRVKTRAQARAQTLETLRTYAYKFYTGDSDAQLKAFISAAAEYDPIRARLLQAYKAEFLDSYHSWLSDGRVYYAHAALVSAVRQLFYYFDTASYRHALLLDRYLKDARDRSKKLSLNRRRVVEAFADWIADEVAEVPSRA